MSLSTHQPQRLTNRQLIDLVEAATGKRALILTVSQFAELVGRHPRTIWEACARGDLPATQAGKGGTYRIPIQALRPYLEGHAA